MIMLMCSATCCTFSVAFLRPVRDLPPRVYQDSMPGKTAMKPLRASRWTFFSDSNERLLSAIQRTLPCGTASSITDR